MYTYASQKNRVVSSALTVTYDVEEVAYTTSGGSAASWFKVTRNATKSQTYLDMSEAVALSVAAEKVALFTRPYYILQRRGESETYPQSLGVTSCPTEISVVAASGRAFNVEIQVRETDVRAAATRPADPASLFTVENARDYDENLVELVIDSVSYDSSSLKTTITYHKSANLPTDSIVAQSLVNGSWVNVFLESRGATTLVTSASAIAQGATIRLACGPVTSDTSRVPLPIYRVTFDCLGWDPSSYPDQYVEQGKCYEHPGTPVIAYGEFGGWMAFSGTEAWPPTKPVVNDLDLTPLFVPGPVPPPEA